MKSSADTIQISNRKSDSPVSSVSSWTDFSDEIKDNNYNNIIVNITTVKTKLNDYSIVAIKDLKSETILLCFESFLKPNIIIE